MKRNFLVVTFLLVNTLSVLACGCIQDTSTDPVGNALNKASVVFSGKVVSAEFRKGYRSKLMEETLQLSVEKEDYQLWVFTFEVERIWKGAKAAEITIVSNWIKTASGTTSISSCDYYFDEGKRYLVYAYEEGGYLWTHACSRTQDLFLAEKDLKRLGKGKHIVRKPVK